jgi:toxin ParE1/3/4
MAYQVILSPTAENDLDGIVAYVARDNAPAAERLGLELLDSALALAEFPRRGRPFRRSGRIRRIVHGNYLIVYRLNEAEKTAEILRFWHAARGEPRL